MREGWSGRFVIPKSEWIEALLDLARPVLTDCDLVACRTDGSSSNLMRGPAASALLVDFDRAGLNDPMPGNFMVGQDGSIMLIDYEYASMNDRCYDLGIWFGEMFYTPQVEAELIEDYFGRCTPELLARVTVHKALADVKWGAWSMVQFKVSALDFDFYKYGVWKLMRFRQIVGDPSWKVHLRNL